jgi:hypothetical protein
MAANVRDLLPDRGPSSSRVGEHAGADAEEKTMLVPTEDADATIAQGSKLVTSLDRIEAAESLKVDLDLSELSRRPPEPLAATAAPTPPGARLSPGADDRRGARRVLRYVLLCALLGLLGLAVAWLLHLPAAGQSH